LRIAGRDKWRRTFKVPKHGLLFAMQQTARHHAIMGHEMGNTVN
jgi:hypothetical protein